MKRVLFLLLTNLIICFSLVAQDKDGARVKFDASQYGKLHKYTNSLSASSFHVLPLQDRNTLSSILSGTLTSPSTLQRLDVTKRNQVQGLITAGAFPAASSESLLTSLVGYWELDEASGTRSDSAGSNHLTDNNTVTSSDNGKVTRSAQFTRTSQESLTIADNAALSMTTTHSMTIAGWFKLDTLMTGTPCAVAKLKPDVSQWEYAIFYDTTSNQWGFSSATAPGGPGNNLLATSHGTLETGKWYFVVAGWDHTTGDQFISVNNGTVDTFNLPSGINDGTAIFTIGSYSSGAGESNFWNGRMCNVGIWKKRLSTTEITRLWNYGLGLTYPFGTDSLWTSATGFWPLTEASGTRSDVIGTSHLTDNNTVTSATSFIPGYTASLFASANQEYLNVADNAALSVGGTDFTLSCWVKPTTNVNAPMMAKYTPSGSQRGYALRIVSTTFQFDLGQDDTTYDNVASSTTPSNGAWFHALVTWTESTHTAVIHINNDGGNSKALAVSGSYDDAAEFCIGSWSSPTGAGQHQNAAIANAGLWKRKLTAAEITRLFNHQ